MNETTYVYIVHSDINENNIYAEFATEEEAIEYAKHHIDELTYVDRAEALVDDEGDIVEIFDSETIWVYADEGEEDTVETEDDYWDRMAQDEADRIDAESCLGDTTWFEDLDTDSLVETLEENEDIVECKECFELFPKADCIKIEVGYLCPHCHGTHCENKECIEDEPIVLFDVADEDVFKVDFPEAERFSFSAENEMVPDESTSEVENDPISEPECVGPECEVPVEAPVTKDETITKLVVDEHEAIDGYDKAKIEIEANSELDEKEKEDILDTIEHIKEEEVEHIEELEELVDESFDILTEASISYGKWFTGEQTKLDVLFSDKESSSKNGERLLYGNGYKLCIYDHTKRTENFGIEEITDWGKYKLSNNVNEYTEIGAAKKDAEKLSKQLKDKTIGIYINEYEETNHPYLYLFKDGKQTVDYAKDKIAQFEKKFETDHSSTKPTDGEQQENSIVTWSFENDNITIEVGTEGGKASVTIYKGDNNVTDKDLKEINFAFSAVKGLKVSEIINLAKISGGVQFEVKADTYNGLSSEIKEKLANGVTLWLTVKEGGSTFRKASCIIKVIKAADQTVGDEPPAEQPPVETNNTQEPTQEELENAYKLLSKKFKREAIKKYVLKDKDGKYKPGPNWGDFKKNEQDIEKLINLLGESLEEHVNEEHPAIESDQELVGTDNAVVDCKVNKVITHSEDEKPVDCEGKKKPLEKPLTESTTKNILDTVKDTVDSRGYDTWIYGGSGYISYCIEIIKDGDEYKANEYISTESGVGDTDPEFIYSSTDFRDVIKFLLDEGYFDTEDPRDSQDISRTDAEGYLRNLTEATHAQVAKPEGSRTLAYNNALTYAKKANKPYIFGYTNHTGKFFALDLPLKVTGSPAEAEKEFRNKYKNSKVVYIAYPDKDFITESKFTKAEQEEYNMDEDGISLDSYDEFVRCGWCGEIFTKDECVFEKDFGWLCDRCQDELKYHGGHLDIIVNPTEEDIERAENNR